MCRHIIDRFGSDPKPPPFLRRLKPSLFAQGVRIGNPFFITVLQSGIRKTLLFK